MEDIAEDSDATVAGDETETNGDTQLSTNRLTACSQNRPHGTRALQATLSTPNEDECSDSSEQVEACPSSPSLLQSVQHLSLSQTQNNDGHDTSKGLSEDNRSKRNQNSENVTPCASDEELSQEFPVLHSSTTAHPIPTTTPLSLTTTSNTPHDQQQSTSSLTPQIPSLNDITNEQNTLLARLNKAEGISEKFAEEAKRNASRIEQTLKAISLSNQAERKRLASEHALLLSQCQFQGGGTSEGTQSIRTQLLDLAAKQKQLLQCFMKQKEISSQLSKVLQTIHVQNRKSPNAAQQTLSTTNSQSTTTALTIQNKNQTLGSSLNMSCKTATTSTPSEALQLRRNTSISTAFPNLSNRLLQPLTLPHPETMPQHQQQSELPLSSKQHTLQTQASSHSQSTQANPEHTHSTSIQQTSHQTQVQSGNKAPVSSNDLSHPVPLKTLMKHGLIQPGRDCVSCTILGCDFKASLSTDSTIVSQDGSRHELPQQWVKSCWARLGHPNKIVKTKQIYSLVLYKGVPLLHFCEKYSLKQVSSYLSQNKQTSDVSEQRQHTHPQTEPENSSKNTQPRVVSTLAPQIYVATKPSTGYVHHSQEQFDIGRILASGHVFVHHCGAHNQTSLELTEDFWEGKESTVSPVVFQQIECDLEW